MLKALILMSCIALFLEPGHASRPLSPQGSDPHKCAQSVPKVAVCLTDMLTNLGRPSTACCKALGGIDDSCMPTLFPTNPLIAPFLKNLCSVASGGGGGSAGGSPGHMPFPFFPFPPVGGGGLPFPFFPFPPFGGSGWRVPFPFFPFPPISGGSGGDLPFPFPFTPPMTGGGGAIAPSPKA